MTGYYKSELQRGIDPEKQLAEKNVGVVVSDEKLGTIFTWIPRLCYSEETIAFLKGTSIVEYIYKTEECFNLIGYGVNSLDLAFEGIWVGQTELGNASQVEQKNNEMNTEENTYGLIANELVQTLTSSDKTAVEKLYNKYSITNNASILQNINTMQNRQTIKIVNTNKRVPISGTHDVAGGNIIVKTKYNENKILYCTDKNGNKLENTHLAPIDEEEINYTFYILDEIGNIKKYTMNYGGGRPYLKGFNKTNTFYVVYNEGIPDTSIPIGEPAPDNWYDYDNQMWANIVCRENGQELYYTWIPRYMYKLHDDTQSVEAIIVDLENKDIKTGKAVNSEEYTLPDAFTWESDEGKVQLTGYWISKYKLRDNTTYTPDIYGLAGTININNVVSQFGSSYTYEAYLIKDGKRLVKNDEGEYVEGTEPVIITGNYKFTKVPAGEYTVNIIIKDSAGNDVQGITKTVTVEEKVAENKPNLSKYNINNTFYVVYNADGSETSYEPIGDIAQDQVKNWYDYDEDKKATIVVKDFGQETYYEWIPRYQCLTSDATRISYIPTSKTEPDAGYTIPSEFSGENADGYWRQIATYSNRIQANESAGSDKIVITNVVLPSGATKFDIYLIKDGKIIKQAENIEENSYTYSNLETGKYVVNIIAKNADGKTLAGYAEEQIVTNIKVALTGFNPNNTFYVVYNDGNIDTSIPIGEKAPINWYDYAEQQWANIVVRENGQELYYTYIPRYEYKLNDALQKTKAMFIPTEPMQVKADIGYTIPDAFSWESDEGTVQLPGYWISKYKLRDNVSYTLDIYGLGGTVNIDNIVSQFGSSYTYEAYLIKDGKRLVKNDEGEYVEGTEPVIITGNYKFTKVPAGEYTVNVILKDSTGNDVQGITKSVTVGEKTEANKPDLSNFNIDTTFFATKNILGIEENAIPIGESIPANWYDYDEDIKATVIVRENGQETYYEWIPRYQYQNGHTDWISYIPTEQTVPDEGYTIPNEFTDSNGNALTGYWKETTKYTNRMYANIAGGDDKIVISSIKTSSSILAYNVYLIKDGIVLNSGTTSDSYTFTGLTQGTYGVLITHKDLVSGSVDASYAQIVNVGVMEIPDVIGYMVDTTYIVVYDSDGNENATQNLRSVLSDDAVINADGALVSGKIDLNKINGTWYDYAKQQWANIVTINDGKTLYFTWIPRYEYMLNDANQATYARFIPKTQTKPDSGYQIPESFSWNNGSEDVALSGYWISKYKLRN